MPRYIYKVRDNATGKIQESQAESSSKDELVNLLHDKNKTVISVEEFTILQSSQKGVLPKKRIFDYFGSIAIRDKINFCSQLATLLESGITLVRALEILAQQMQSEKFRLIILQVKEDIKQGLALHKAFAKKPDVFSPLWINLIETGEASGELPSVLRELAKYFELSALIRSKLTTALIYPSIIMVAAILAIIVFVTFLVPMFEELFKSFNTQLPFLTLMVVKLSGFVRHYFLVGLGIFVVLVFILRNYFNTFKGRKIFDRFKLSMPIFGEFLVKVAMVRFSNALSVLMKGGVPILYSLDVVKKTIGNSVLSDIIEKVKIDVRKGEEMAQSLGKHSIIPAIAVQMIQVGEETGELSNMLDKVKSYYNEEVNIFVSRFSTIIEPIMILIVGIIVAFLVASMFLPIFMRASLGGV